MTTKDRRLEQILLGGVVGGGGAGFPTWKKLDTQVDYLIINGAECEPLLKSDQYLMSNESKRLVKALEICGEITGATKLVIALKNIYREQIDVLSGVIAETDSTVTLALLDPIYPAGDEQVIIQRVTGRIVPPTGLPSQVGCVVLSVSTALAVLDALENIPSKMRIITVAGEVNNPQLFLVPVGTPISQLVKEAGGTTAHDTRIIMGGPMMGGLIKKGEEDSTYITKTDGGMIVLPDSHPLICSRELSHKETIRRARSVCIQCRLCTDACPRYILGHNIQPHIIMRAIGFGKCEPEILANAKLCSECGMCEVFACPMGLSPRNINAHLKATLGEVNDKVDTKLYQRPPAVTLGRNVNAARVAQRASVTRYSDVKETLILVVSDKVVIPLKQHIGVPAMPTVKVGDRVIAGQRIGEVPDGALGAPVHSSIDGVVTKVTEIGVSIERDD